MTIAARCCSGNARLLPIDRNDPTLKLYLPLWYQHGDMTGNPIYSYDIYRHSCTVTGTTLGITGRDFDGTDDVIDLGSPTALDNIFDGGGTYEAWVNLDTFGEEGEGKIIDRAYTTFLVSDRTAIRTYTKSIFFAKFFGGDNGEWMTGDNTLLASTWNHVAVTYNANSTANVPIFYINGAVSTRYQVTAPTGARDSDAGDTQYIGNNSAGSRAFDGKIGEVRAYSRILTLQQIQSNRLATKWRYA